MRSLFTTKRTIGALTCSAMLAAGLAAGCSPQHNDDAPTPVDDGGAAEEQLTPEQQAVIDGEEGTTFDQWSADAFPGKEWIDDLQDVWRTNNEEYAPEVRTLPDGRMVQRTPTETEIQGTTRSGAATDNLGAWMQGTGVLAWNTYWLDADNRGCLSCHGDLKELVKNMSVQHVDIWTAGTDAQFGVQQCIFCHSYAPGYIVNNYAFGTLIHGIHMGTRNADKFEGDYNGKCISCHNATGDGEGFQLWDDVKYDQLWGINRVSDVQGEFSTEQETTQTMEDSLIFDWMNSFWDMSRRAAGPNGLNLDMPQSLFDDWPITIEGNVAEPYTARLGDLVAEAEAEGVVVTKVSKMVCDWNAIGAGAVSNVEITGIPVSWLVDKAGGYLDGSTGVMVPRGDGTSRRSFTLEKLDGGESFLVYKMDGKFLDSARGYPCTNWVEGVDAEIDTKQPTVYRVLTEPVDWDDHFLGNPNGWYDEDGTQKGVPNATILGVPEGLIIQNGQPHTFRGYAEAFDKKILNVEISLDNGATWTKYDIGDYDVNKMLWWDFTFTPEKEGAYVLKVRATDETGKVSPMEHTALFNAYDEMPEPEDTTVLEHASLVPAKHQADEADRSDES